MNRSILGLLLLPFTTLAALSPANLRTEWLPNPPGIDAEKPRVSWRVESEERGQRQTAYRVLVASGVEVLEKGEGTCGTAGKSRAMRR